MTSADASPNIEERRFNQYIMLSKQDLDFIHEKTLQVLSEDGIEIDSPQALEIFNEHGIRTDESRVYPDEKALESALERIPGTFTLRARNPDYNVRVGGEEGPLLGPPLGAPFNHDRGQEEYSSYEDYIRFVKLYHQLPQLDLAGGDITPPTDIPEESRHRQMFYAAAAHSDKPLFGTGTGKKCRETLEMGRLLFGSDNFKSGYYLLKVVGASSPRRFDSEPLQTLISWAESNQPLAVYAQILAGVSGPPTVAGLLIQQNAEILTGALLAQLINPGTPIIYGSFSSAGDMQTGSITVGSGIQGRVIAATAELADYYGMPSLTAGAITDSSETGMQAGAEGMMNAMTAARAGVDILVFAAGAGQNYLGISGRKALMDMEMYRIIDSYRQGIEVSERTAQGDAISAVEPGESYLTHPSTLELLQKEGNLGRKNDFENPQEKMEEMLADYSRPELDESIEKELKEMI